MTTHEYLQKLGIKPESCIQLAFMVGEVREVHSHYKEFVYHSTPCRVIWEWYNKDRTDEFKDVRSKILDYVILNNEVYDLPWLSGASWTNRIKMHDQMMILVASKEELLKRYSEKDVESMIAYIDRKIEEGIANGTNPWLGKKW